MENENGETKIFVVDDLLTRQTVYVTAVILLLSARRIARSTATYYVAAFAGGVFASTMVLAYLLRSFVPRSFSFIPLYLTSWPFSAYIFYKLWLNFDLLLNEYFSYLISYFAIVLLLSSSACYRFGTPTDERTLNLVQWGLQLGSVVAIYLSFRSHYLTILTILAALLWSTAMVAVNRIITYFFVIFNRLRAKWFGPTPRRLLTEEEYKQQSVRNTDIELQKLRHVLVDELHYGNLNIEQLRRSDRMSSFISGQSDLSDTEMRDYTIYAKSGYTETPWRWHRDNSSSSLNDFDDEREEEEPASQEAPIEKSKSPLAAATPDVQTTPDRPFFRQSPPASDSASRNGLMATPTNLSPPPLLNGSSMRASISGGSAARLRWIANSNKSVGSTPRSAGSTTNSPATPLSSRRKTPIRGSLRESNDGRPYNSPLVQPSAAPAMRRTRRRTGNFISSDEDE